MLEIALTSSLDGEDSGSTTDESVDGGEPTSTDSTGPEAANDGDATATTSSFSRDRGRIFGLGAIGAFVAVGIGLIAFAPRKAAAPPPPLALTSADLASADAGSKDRAEAVLGDGGAVVVAAPAVERPRPPPAWRVVGLKNDPNLDVVEGTFGKRGLVGSLTQAGVPRAEIRRITQAFDGIHRIDRPLATDGFVLAKDKSKGTIVAFEYVSSPLDVWQARSDESVGVDRIIAKKLELFVEHRRVASGLVVSGDLAKAITSAGLRPEIVDAVDDALEGHVEAGAIKAGVRMRIAATEDWVEGTFARVKVDAVEFVPAKSGTPVRIYFYERDASVEGSRRRAPAAGFYDAKGKQPYHGAFRTPLPLARVTSRFNPKRMHPVLKVVMPHNGVDYGATTGTPVYSAGAGTVVSAGNGGPCGNMVEIDHGSGITTVYCHLKGFAPGIHGGLKVEPRQHIGFVGQTGRVTGPHLHFGVKKNGAFIDPLGLKMDGVRVLPPADRDAFAKKRSELDVVIDGVLLPSAADVPDEPEPEDKDLHE